MPEFSKSSLAMRNTIDQRLQAIVDKAIEITDFVIMCGFRDEKSQNEAFKNGASKLPFPKSKHNVSPSLAVDLAPWPVSWAKKDEWRFHYLAGVMKGVAKVMDIDLIWGGEWKGFPDLPHFELRK